MSLFRAKPCPYCGEHTFGFWRKTRLSPWFGCYCSACGGLVTVPWFTRYVQGLIFFVPFFYLLAFPTADPEFNLFLRIGVGLLIGIVTLPLDFVFTPLLRMKPDNSRGEGYSTPISTNHNATEQSKPFFAPQSCPYCGEATFGFWRKVHLNAFYGRGCTACRGLVTLPLYSNFLVGVIPGLPIFWFIPKPDKSLPDIFLAIGLVLFFYGYCVHH